MPSEECLWHAEIMGQKPREIAPVLGIEPNPVWALLIRARAGLHAAYEQQQPKWDLCLQGRNRTPKAAGQRA
jgi:DNA-directed RNA polymerase specialized sigma24 family protein